MYIQKKKCLFVSNSYVGPCHPPPQFKSCCLLQRTKKNADLSLIILVWWSALSFIQSPLLAMTIEFIFKYEFHFVNSSLIYVWSFQKFKKKTTPTVCLNDNGNNKHGAQKKLLKIRCVKTFTYKTWLKNSLSVDCFFRILITSLFYIQF